MAKAKKLDDEEIETRGYLQGIAEGMYRAMRLLNERAGEEYKRRNDTAAAFYRTASNEVAKLAGEAQAQRDKEFPREGAAIGGRGA